jgi:Family of unknown function (DUF6328)
MTRIAARSRKGGDGMTVVPHIGAVRRDDAWNEQHRSEAPLQRADRNFAELLQEIRVLLTGVQILLGFLLAIALSPYFRSLDTFQTVVYVVSLFCGTISSTLLVAPIAAHRRLFQCGRKREVVRTGHLMTQAALVGLAGTLCCGLLLVLDLVVGRPAALGLTAALLIAIGVLWIGVPVLLRRR